MCLIICDGTGADLDEGDKMSCHMISQFYSINEKLEFSARGREMSSSCLRLLAS